MIAGIYKITNKINNESYIGFSSNIFMRINYHFSKTKNIKIKTALNKYGIENFKVEILEALKSDYTLNHSESYYIDLYDSVNNGYNIDKGNITTDYSGHFNKRNTIKKMKKNKQYYVFNKQ